MRARQQRLKGEANASLEAALVRADIVEGHEVGDIALGGRPAVGLRGEAREDAARAYGRFLGRGRAAVEDLLPARRLGHARDAVGAAHGEFAQMGDGGESQIRPTGIDRAPERSAHFLHRPFEGLDEGGRHASRAGTHEDGVGNHLPALLLVLCPTAQVDVQNRDPLAVEGDLDLLVGRLPADAVELHPEHVLPVRGEGVGDGDAAARPVGRPVHTNEL